MSQSRIVTTMEARVQDFGGRWLTDTPGRSYENWTALFGHFERVTVIARRAWSSGSPVGVPVNGPGVELVTLQSARGGHGVVAGLASAAGVFRAVGSRQSAVLLRLPGVVGIVAFAACVVRRRPFSVELVANPAAVGSALAQTWPQKAQFWLMTVLTRRAVRRASAVLYVTEESLQREFPPGPHAQEFAASDVDIPSNDIAPLPRSVWGSRRRAIMVGSLEQRYKGHEYAIRAMAKPVLRDASLDIVGGGALRPQLEQLAKELGLDHRIRFRGPVSERGQLWEMLDAADLFLMPSLTEGMPRALVEAMARGLPVIASEVGGIPEVIGKQYLVTPGDIDQLAYLWAWLLSDVESYRQASGENLSRAHDFEKKRLGSVRSEFLRALGQSEGQ